MRFIPVLVILLLTEACDQQEQLDCTSINLVDFSECEAANKGKTSNDIMLACLPFSEPIKTSGIWVVGFEKNDFFEGPNPPSAEVMWTGQTGADLMVPEDLFRPTHAIQALEVEVIGRRSMCAIAPVNPYPIAVQKLRVVRRIKAP